MHRGWLKPKQIWLQPVSELSKADVHMSQFRWQIVPDSRSGNRKVSVAKTVLCLCLNESYGTPTLYLGHLQYNTIIQSLCCHRQITGNNNNNNNYDNVYGAVNVTVIARVHPVHLMNTDWTPGGRQPSDQTNWFGLWVRRSAAVIRRHHFHLLWWPRTVLIGR